MNLVDQDNKFMMLALMASQNSRCCSQKIGAVIAMPDPHERFLLKQVSTGWNDTVGSRYDAGCTAHNKKMLSPEGKLMAVSRPDHSAWSDREEIHAEMRAILEANKDGVVLKNATLYTTQSPCNQCSKTIGFYGWHEMITRVVYLDKYDRGGDDWYGHLIDHGIIIEKMSREQLKFINFDGLTLNNNE